MLAEMYKNGEDSSMYDRLDNFYKTLDINNPTVQDTEMDIYLTYLLTITFIIMTLVDT